MTKRLALGFCGVALLTFGGAAAILASEGPRIVPVGTDPRLLAAIRKANSEFEVAMTKADTTSIAEPYTTDAVFLNTDGTVVKGRDQIEQLYRDRFARSGAALETKIESEQIMLDGDLAYERGRGSITLRGKDGRVTSRARFLTVWQRQSGGDWKIFRNVVLPDR